MMIREAEERYSFLFLSNTINFEHFLICFSGMYEHWQELNAESQTKFPRHIYILPSVS